MDELLEPTKIIYSNRKTLQLSVNNKGELIVRAPYKIPNKKIINFILEKSNWIIAKRKEALSSLNPIRFYHGEKITLFGQEYEIMFYDKNRVVEDKNCILLPHENYKTKFVNFIKGILNKYISEILPNLAKEYNFKFKSFKITKAKTRWGSCSAKGNLNFSVYLVFCPHAVVNYVIIHELCHTKIANHSAKFWGLVKDCCKDYRELDRFLTNNKHIMNYI